MTGILLALVCLAANAFFVAAEFALAKVRPTALEALAKAGDGDARRALEITHKLDAYLSACQLGITVASLGLGSLAEPAIAEQLEHLLVAAGLVERAADGSITPWIHGVAATFALTVMSVAHIVIGEQVPKVYALQRPELISRLSSRPLKFFFYLSYPGLIALNGAANFCLRLLRLPVMEYGEGKLSLEELRLLIQASLDQRGLEGQKRELLERVLRATDRPVRAVMIPRVDMEVLSLDDDWNACMQRVRRFGFSRFPIAENGDPDKVVGYVYVKDLLMASRKSSGSPIRELKRDIAFVPESRTVGQVLSDFQADKIPLAIVVDEYGGTSGMVTLEDILEELVGDIQDELQVAEPRLSMIDDGSVITDGSLPIGDLSLEGLEAPPIEGAETVGGYILATLGRLAHPGDRLLLGRYEAVVQDVRERRVHRVAFRPLSDAELAEAEARPRSIPPDSQRSSDP